ncbi:MAG TPA: hypothetical protein VG456_17105 [Candidatus Sulfopaludibacter sp.]|jgi:hypothetical protein|nr:hypothetical protein [Candidatus Sulfopaludibacter sp.]
MRTILTSGLVVIAGVVSPVAFSTMQAPKLHIPDYRKDPRFAILRKFFEVRECPASAYSHVFLEAADSYHLDWRLLPSISFVESTGGKAARNNNIFGWDSGRAHFTTPTAGIHAVGYSLSHLSQYKRKSLDQVLATYNPDSEYAQKVKSVMRRIAPVQ